MSTQKILAHKSLVIVFTYAPAGLGHLRVTKALYAGLPKGTNSVLLGSHDQAIRQMHRLMSIFPALKTLSEIGQSGIPEDIVTLGYRQYLRDNTNLIYEQITTVLDERIHFPNTVLVVSTHFGLAHQLAAIKEKLAKTKKIKVILIVQVTDDSPQHIWYVPGADLTFVPSNFTRDRLAEYGRSIHLAPTKFVVTSYPVSPMLGKRLTLKEMQDKKKQLYPRSRDTIHLSIPISGAAVGADFVGEIAEELTLLSSRFFIHVVSKNTSYTAEFLRHMSLFPNVELLTSTHDRVTVDLYDRLLSRKVIPLEITKPSEQAFKALLSPRQHGGVILLFSSPVGRQEYDNLYFLSRHNLIPNQTKQEHLWELATNNKPLNTKSGAKLLQEAKHWRGIRLPNSPTLAARFIIWLLKEKLLLTMLAWTLSLKNENKHAHELTDNGVQKFWQEVALYIDSMDSLHH